MRLAFAILCLCCARATAPPPTTATAAPRADNKRIVIQLDHALGTDHAHAGDPFTARVIHGGVREDTRVLGVVTESRRGDQDHDPVLRLRVDSLERAACQVPLHARITSAEVKEVSAPPGDGYRSGAVVGGVLGGTMMLIPGAVAGFGLGFAAGTISEARKGKIDTFLEQGALLTVELQRPVPPCPLPS